MITIAIAEDQQILREGLRALLCNEPGIKLVAEYKNGQEVIENIKEVKPHVAVMDIRMPEVDGFKATEFIATNVPEVKVLALTVLGDKKTCAKMIRAGARGYLPKNVGKDDLVHAIKKVAMGDIYICPQIALNIMDIQEAPNIKVGNPAALTRREIEVLGHISQGLTNNQIAEKTYTSRRTIETHRMNLMKKTGCVNTAALIKYAMQHELIK